MCADGCDGCNADCSACAAGCFGCGGCDKARPDESVTALAGRATDLSRALNQRALDGRPTSHAGES